MENSLPCIHHSRILAERLKVALPSQAGSLFRPPVLFMEGLASVNSLSLTALDFSQPLDYLRIFYPEEGLAPSICGAR